MKDWNIVVTIFQDGFWRALRALRALGPIERTPYHNVLANRMQGTTVLQRIFTLSKVSIGGRFDQRQTHGTVGNLFFLYAGKP